MPGVLDLAPAVRNSRGEVFVPIMVSGICRFHEIQNLSHSFFGLPLVTHGRAVASPYGHSEYSSHRIAWVRLLLILLYAVISVLGLVSNIIVVAILMRHRAMHNITNIFVMALATSDIFLCTFNMPIQAYYEIKETSMLSTSLCRALFASFGLPMYMSSLTILLIATDRYRIIIYPLRPRMRHGTAACLLVGIMVFSLINAVPVAIYTYAENPATHVYCVERWPDKTMRFVYSMMIFTVQFLCPLVVTGILYLRIYWRLRERAFKKKDADRKKRTNKILMAIVICFAICWSPWALYSLLLEIKAFQRRSAVERFLERHRNCSRVLNDTFDTFFQPVEDTTMYSPIDPQHVKLIDLILKVVAMSSACINPFLYGWLNESLRDVMCKMCRRCCGRSLHRGSFESQRAMKDRNARGRYDGEMEGAGEHFEHRYRLSTCTPSMFEQSTKRTSLYPSTTSPRCSISTAVPGGGPRGSTCAGFGTKYGNLLTIPAPDVQLSEMRPPIAGEGSSSGVPGQNSPECRPKVTLAEEDPGLAEGDPVVQIIIHPDEAAVSQAPPPPTIQRPSPRRRSRKRSSDFFGISPITTVREADAIVEAPHSVQRTFCPSPLALPHSPGHPSPPSLGRRTSKQPTIVEQPSKSESPSIDEDEIQGDDFAYLRYLEAKEERRKSIIKSERRRSSMSAAARSVTHAHHPKHGKRFLFPMPSELKRKSSLA